MRLSTNVQLSFHEYAKHRKEDLEVAPGLNRPPPPISNLGRLSFTAHSMLRLYERAKVSVCHAGLPTYHLLSDNRLVC